MNNEKIKKIMNNVSVIFKVDSIIRYIQHYVISGIIIQHFSYVIFTGSS